MKTNLSIIIDSKTAAEQYLTDLISNGEVYHLDDDANDVIWCGDSPTEAERIQLNHLAEQVFKYISDPFEFILIKINGNEGIQIDQ